MKSSVMHKAVISFRTKSPVLHRYAAEDPRDLWSVGPWGRGTVGPWGREAVGLWSLTVALLLA